ncbi:hypothetical protein OH76DRAFT_1485318 [Lentinus brumalis]|uniref:Secreted protein n=1 Tax=Lentinus brumalis TaxID=2498619 RepID=A0A371D283_9APHY|nr:hypothetical protein OH76DRAFT_1485318 [Polyporus brumalis]
MAGRSTVFARAWHRLLNYLLSLFSGSTGFSAPACLFQPSPSSSFELYTYLLAWGADRILKSKLFARDGVAMRSRILAQRLGRHASQWGAAEGQLTDRRPGTRELKILGV